MMKRKGKGKGKGNEGDGGDGTGADAARKKEAGMEDIPEEVWVAIFSLLPIDSLSSVTRVSRRFHAIADDDALWRPLLAIHFPTTLETHPKAETDESKATSSDGDDKKDNPLLQFQPPKSKKNAKWQFLTTARWCRGRKSAETGAEQMEPFVINFSSIVAGVEFDTATNPRAAELFDLPSGMDRDSTSIMYVSTRNAKIHVFAVSSKKVRHLKTMSHHTGGGVKGTAMGILLKGVELAGGEEVRNLLVHHSDKWMVSSYCLGDLHIWRKPCKKSGWYCTHPELYEDDIAINSSLDYVVSGSSRNSTVKIWDAKQGRCVLSLGESDDKYKLKGMGTLLSHGNYVLLGQHEGITVVDIRTGEVERVLTECQGLEYGCMKSHEPSGTFVTQEQQKLMKVWDWDKLEVIYRAGFACDRGFSWNGVQLAAGFNVWEPAMPSSDGSNHGDGYLETYSRPPTRTGGLYGSWADDHMFICWGPNLGSHQLQMRPRRIPQKNNVKTEEGIKDEGLGDLLTYDKIGCPDIITPEEQSQIEDNEERIRVRGLARDPAWRDVLVPEAEVEYKSALHAISKRSTKLHSPFVSVEAQFLAVGGTKTVRLYNYAPEGWTMRKLQLSK